jgi:hypothetical protein
MMALSGTAPRMGRRRPPMMTGFETWAVRDIALEWDLEKEFRPVGDDLGAGAEDGSVADVLTKRVESGFICADFVQDHEEKVSSDSVAAWQ